MLQCTKCFSPDIIPIGITHYICNNENCISKDEKVQFIIEYDKELQFPYNQIFRYRKKTDFYKKFYLNT